MLTFLCFLFGFLGLVNVGFWILIINLVFELGEGETFKNLIFIFLFWLFFL